MKLQVTDEGGRPFIVAEISKNWKLDMPTPGLPLHLQFEEVLATNLRRGYILDQFQLHRVMVGPDEMNETIIAVFERCRAVSRKPPEVPS